MATFVLEGSASIVLLKAQVKVLKLYAIFYQSSSPGSSETNWVVVGSNKGKVDSVYKRYVSGSWSILHSTGWAMAGVVTACAALALS